jgi:uncharacterized protein involved in type VI secretion and phage assembly
MNGSKQKFYGKYRGTVLNNVDLEREGKIQVQVPDVLGPGISSWARPCLPFSGIQQGMFVAPNIGSGVWVEFEQGDQDYPIWVGGFWGSAAEVPALAQATPPGLQSFCINTIAQNTLLLSDMPGPTGGFLLKTTTGAIISVSDAGILISNGKGATILMAGPSVTINAGALVVT